jgi:hypothetical protein
VRSSPTPPKRSSAAKEGASLQVCPDEIYVDAEARELVFVWPEEDVRVPIPADLPIDKLIDYFGSR